MAVSSFDLSAWAWNVATTGALARSVANMDVDGVSGSWACTTSGPNERSASPTRRKDATEKRIGATVKARRSSQKAW